MGRSTILLPLLLLGLYIFTKGFFLTRIEIRGKSSCQLLPYFYTKEGGQRDENFCWLPTESRFKRLVLLVIDGWRFDFADPTLVGEDGQDGRVIPTGEEPLGRESTRSQRRLYTGQMPKLRQLLQDSHEGKSSAKLFKFIADPPTVTMQRLKGLMSGSLPTFVDASANFASTEILEDNLISQFSAAAQHHDGNQRPMVFLGDDTWTGLFPSQFTVSVPLPSFDVKDLDTVDDGVLKHLYGALQGNYSSIAGQGRISGNDNGAAGSASGKPSLLVGHFLGVDHVGHRYSTPSHSQMTRKLHQMDDAIHRVITEEGLIDDDTLLVVMGDHGMTTVGGNHGGASKEEITAAMLMYSKRKGLFAGGVDGTSGIAASSPFISFPTISQVDIVPTIALLLGLPIPYASLGAVIEGVNFAPLPPTETTTTATSSLLSSAAAHHVNAHQLLAYLHAYNGVAGTFASHQLAELTASVKEGDEMMKKGLEDFLNSLPKGFDEAAPIQEEKADTEEVHTLRGKQQSSPTSSPPRSLLDLYREALEKLGEGSAPPDASLHAALSLSLSSVISSYRSMLLSSASLCRNLWTRFNEVSMIVGLVAIGSNVLLGVWSLFAPKASETGDDESKIRGVTVWRRLFICSVLPFAAMLLLKPQALVVGCFRAVEASLDVLSKVFSVLSALASMLTPLTSLPASLLAAESQHLSVASGFVRASLPVSFLFGSAAESPAFLEELPVETWLVVAMILAYLFWPSAASSGVGKRFFEDIGPGSNATVSTFARGSSTAVLLASNATAVRKRGQAAPPPHSVTSASSNGDTTSSTTTTMAAPRKPTTTYLAGSLAILLLLLRCDALFTNSFIVAEHTVIAHLLSGIVVLVWYDCCKRIWGVVQQQGDKRRLVMLASVFALVCLVCIRLTVQRDGWLWPFPPPSDVVSSTATLPSDEDPAAAAAASNVPGSSPAPIPKVETGTGKSSIGWVLEAGVVTSEGDSSDALPLSIWRTVWLQAISPVLLVAFYLTTLAKVKIAGNGSPSSSPSLLLVAAATIIPQLAVSIYWHAQQVSAALLPAIMAGQGEGIERLSPWFVWMLRAAMKVFAALSSQPGPSSPPSSSNLSLPLVDASASIRLSLPRAVYRFSLASLVPLTSVAIGSSRRRHQEARTPSPPPFIFSVAAFVIVLPSFSLLLGPGSTVVLLAIGLQATALAGLRQIVALAETTAVESEAVTQASSPFASRFVACAKNLLTQPLAMHSFALSWSCLHYYLATGHGNQFNSLHFSAPFVGFDTAAAATSSTSDTGASGGGGGGGGSSLLFSALLMVINTLVAHICFFGLFGWDLVAAPSSFSLGLLSLILPNSIALLCISIFCMIARRHLMVWAIFAPKFVFDSLHLLSAVLIGGLIVAFASTTRKVKPKKSIGAEAI
jgi:Type I phosphodiesterase / nucleotide pyrophosphatase